MSRYIYANDALIQSWDDETRTYTDHRTGESRPYTVEENAEADRQAEQEQKAANDQALRDGLAAAIDAALARQAAYQAVLDTPNSEINSKPAPHIVAVARQGKRSERALIRLARLVGGLTDSTGTGSD